MSGPKLAMPGPAAAPRRPGKASMVAVLTRLPDTDGGWLRELDTVVDGLEVRADLVGDLDPGWLRRHFSGTLTYNLRSVGHGGHAIGGPDERLARLLAAARHYDFVDLEWDHDLTPAALASVSGPRRRISHHCHSADVVSLRNQFDKMAATAAGLYLLSTASTEAALPTMLGLAALGRTDVTAFATGPAGTWSRILAPWLGAPVVFGQATGSASTAEMPTVEQLTVDYGLPALPPLREVYGIVGGSVSQSLSPRLHNAAYRELGMAALYLPFQSHDVTGFWREFATSGLDELGLPLRGITVTGTHKQDAVRLGDKASALSLQIGAANILCREGDSWRADTTDAAGVTNALAASGIDPAGRHAAVVGCGGAGRAAVAALRAAGADVTVVNRGQDNGRRAAHLFNVPLVPLSEFSASAYSLIVHATPVANRMPFNIDDLRGDTAILEFVYHIVPTPLVSAARARGLPTVDGWDVLAEEVRHQFRLMTGLDMPLRPVRSPAPRPNQTEVVPR